jgi:hypothetical protein
MAYASKTGVPNIISSCLIAIGGKEEEQDLMKRIRGIGKGKGFLRII